MCATGCPIRMLCTLWYAHLALFRKKKTKYTHPQIIIYSNINLFSLDNLFLCLFIVCVFFSRSLPSVYCFLNKCNMKWIESKHEIGYTMIENKIEIDRN